MNACDFAAAQSHNSSQWATAIIGFTLGLGAIVGGIWSIAVFCRGKSYVYNRSSRGERAVFLTFQLAITTTGLSLVAVTTHWMFS